MNTVILTGRIVREPELKSTQSGASVCNITIAVRRDWKNEQGEYITDFIDIVAWRQQAEFIANYFTKGKNIEIVGELQTRSYTDKEGKNRKVYEVLANKVSFGASGKSEEATEQSNEETTSTDELTDAFMDNVVFGYEPF
jgi:single-strand DNA-binding protein